MAEWCVSKTEHRDGERCSAARAALGFRGPVLVSWAMSFMARMFEAIANGKHIDAALAEAREGTREGDPQWALPILYAPPLLEVALTAESKPRARFQPRSLLPHSSVPYFFGRDAERKRLHNWFASKPKAALVIAGESGLGKTELACRFAEELVEKDRLVLWFDARVVNLPQLATLMLAHLEPGEMRARDTNHASSTQSEEQRLEDLTSRVHATLAPYSGLIVFDNAHDLRVLDLIPDTWKALVTTSSVVGDEGVDLLSLDNLHPEAGLAVLSEILWGGGNPDHEMAAAKELVASMARPLDLALAAHTIGRARLTIDAYLAARSALAKQAWQDNATVEATILLAKDRLGPTELTTIQALATFPPAGVPLEMLAVAVGAPEPEVQDALSRLRREGFCKTETKTGRHSMHPRLGLALRQQPIVDGTSWQALLDRIAIAYGGVISQVDGIRSVDRRRERWRLVRDIFDGLDLGTWLESGLRAPILADALVCASIYSLGQESPLPKEWLADVARLANAASEKTRGYLHLEEAARIMEAGDFSNAHSRCSQALKLFESCSCAAGIADSRLARATIGIRAGESSGVLKDLQEALKIFASLGKDDRIGTALEQRSLFYERLGRTINSNADATEALAAYQRAEDTEGRIRATRKIARFAFLRGDPERAAAGLESALSLAEAGGFSSAKADVLISRVDMCLLANPAKAMADATLALSIYVRIGDRLGQANALKHQGRCYEGQYNHAKAEQCYAMASRIYREVGDHLGLGQISLFLGNFHVLHNGPGRALSHFDEALRLLELSGSRTDVANALESRGQLRARNGDLDGGRADLVAAMEIHLASGSVNGEANTRAHLADLVWKEGKSEDAAREFRECLALYERQHNDLGAGHALQSLGDIARAQKDYNHALSYYGRSEQRYEKIRRHFSLANVLVEMSLCYVDLGRLDEAQAKAKRALSLANASSNEHAAGRAREILRRLQPGREQLIPRPRDSITNSGTSGTSSRSVQLSNRASAPTTNVRLFLGLVGLALLLVWRYFAK
jgi:tetratricopeptide (TPR) repeat protein